MYLLQRQRHELSCSDIWLQRVLSVVVLVAHQRQRGGERGVGHAAVAVPHVHKRLLPMSGGGKGGGIQHGRSPWKPAGKPHSDGVNGLVAADAPGHARSRSERDVYVSSGGSAHVEAAVLHCIRQQLRGTDDLDVGL